MEGGEGIAIASLCRFIVLIFLLLTMTNFGDQTSHLRDDEEQYRKKMESQALNNQLLSDLKSIKSGAERYAFNVSGSFSGHWNRSSEPYSFRDTAFGLAFDTDGRRLPGNTTLKGEDGLFSLQLFDHGPFRYGIHHLEGNIAMIEGEQDSSDDALSLSLHGLYFIHSGRLTLYANTRSGRLAIDWKTNDMKNQFNITNKYSELIGYSKGGSSRLYIQRPDPFESATTRCLYRLNMELLALQDGVHQEISLNHHSKLMLNATGSLTSLNCGVEVGMSFGGFNMDTNHITSKTRILTICVIATTFLQAKVYIDIYRQMSSTTSNPASLTTFLFLSAIDLLIAMIHSLISVFFMGLFSVFYIVSFAKFFLFSIITMRLIAMIWVARNSNINNNANGMDNQNMILAQRKFSLLFLGMYVVIIITLISVYEQTRLGYALLTLLYSFWVPQVGLGLV